MQTNAYVFYVNLNHVFLLCDDVTKSKKVSSKKPKAVKGTKTPKEHQKRPSRGKKKKKETSLSHISSNLEIISLFTSLSLFLSSKGSSLENTFATGKKKARVFRRFAFLPTTLSFSRIKEI
jgi:hypothetical protein